MEEALSHVPRMLSWSNIGFRTSLVVRLDIMCTVVDESAGRQLFQDQTHEKEAGGAAIFFDPAKQDKHHCHGRGALLRPSRAPMV